MMRFVIAAEGSSNPETPANEPLLVFVHIQKTAGYSLRRILLREYRGRRHVRLLQNFFVRPEGSREEVSNIALTRPSELRVVHGHIMFWPDIEWSPDTRFFTMLRDPVERAISHYYWMCERSTRFRVKTNLEQAVADGAVPDNLQTRVLSASAAPFGEIPEGALEQAIENLDRFSVVGLTERFDESLVLLSREFGWRRGTYERANVTAGRTPREDVAPDTLALLEHHNALDTRLYAQARARFDRDVAREGVGFGIEVDALRRANVRSAEVIGESPLDVRLPNVEGIPRGPIEAEKLLVETQAELIVRDQVRIAESAARKALEEELAASTKQTTNLLSKLTHKDLRTRQSEEQAARLEAKLREARQLHQEEMVAIKKAHNKRIARLESKIDALSRERERRRAATKTRNRAKTRPPGA